MVSAGETSVVPKGRAYGPYVVDKNNVVIEGEYKGWQVGQCHHGSADGAGVVDTMRVPDLKLSADQMQRLTESRQYRKNFHIYLDGNIHNEKGVGTVCLYYQNPSENRSAQGNLDCSYIFDESIFESAGRWIAGVGREFIPFIGHHIPLTKCDKLKAFYGDYNPLKKPTFWENVFHAGLFGLMFVVMHDAWQGAKGNKTILGKAWDKIKKKFGNGNEKGPKGPDDSDPPAQTGGSREHRAPDKPPAAKLVEAAGGKAAAGAGEDTPSEAAAAERSAVQTSLSYDPWERLTKAFFGDAAIVQGARVYSEAKAARARARALTAKVKPAAQAVRVRPKPVRTGGMRGFGVRGVSFRPSFAGAAAGFGNTVFSLGGFFFDGIEYAQARADEGGTSDLDDVFNFFEGMNLGAKCLMWGPGSDSRCSPPSKFPEFDEYHRQRYGPPIDQYFVPRSPMI